MKKFLALFLALLMVLSLAACGDKTDTNDKTDTGTTDTGKTDTGDTGTTPDTPDTGDTGDSSDVGTEAGPTVAAPEEITAEPLYYNGFETTDGLTAVHRGDKSATPEMTGANYSILPSVHEIMLLPGVDGTALAVDGKYGVKLENVPKTADDSYTIAFWYAADRYGEFMPILDIGHNTGLADAEGPAWLRFTRANTWSVTGAECAPVVWDRNAAVDTWPWIGNNADEQGKKEWVHVAIVADGVEYQDSIGKPHVGATFYLNGVPVMSADASHINYTDEAGNTVSDDWMGLTTGILSDEGQFGIECYFGINYWDSLFKGYMDELYIYDEALTAGQIATLYTKFTAPAYESITYDGPLDEEAPEPEAPTLPEITPDANAIDAVGTVALDAGFWSDTTDGYEVADGSTVTIKMNNYSDGLNNWDNFVLGFSNTPVTTDKVAGAADFPGYFEWFVLRADAYGWAPEGAAYNPTFEAPADWAAWLALMTDAEVTAAITRNGGEITVDYTFTGADGTVITEKATVTSNLTAADPCYVHVTTDHAYVEILSVE